jgi:hypothetical protein
MRSCTGIRSKSPTLSTSCGRNWNTLQITDIVDKLRAQGEAVDPATLSHISLLPFKHVVPNGTYFIEDMEQG